jgi:hypothetical protein
MSEAGYGSTAVQQYGSTSLPLGTIGLEAFFHLFELIFSAISAISAVKTLSGKKHESGCLSTVCGPCFRRSFQA